MRRFEVESRMAFWAGPHKSNMVESKYGEYVLHAEAQAEIARLQAEVERLKSEEPFETECDGSIAIDWKGKVWVHSDSYKEMAMDVLSAWNDAIEAAAHLIECDGDAMNGKADAARLIRALKRPTGDTT